LPDMLKEVLQPQFKTNLLYKTKASGVQSRLENLLELGNQLLSTVKELTDVTELQPIVLLRRFIKEQGIWDESKN
jgi:hypothetical protein